MVNEPGILTSDQALCVNLAIILTKNKILLQGKQESFNQNKP